MVQYSVAEAEDGFSRILREVETGSSVQITRHGKTVAYLVAADQYSGPEKPRVSFIERLAEFRCQYPEGVDLDPDEWLRDEHSKTPGRDFSW